MNFQVGTVVRYALAASYWILVASCAPSIQETRLMNVPVSLYKPGIQGISINHVYTAVANKIHEKLPNAYFTGMVITGKCEDLRRLSGRLIFVFTQVSMAIPRASVWDATASVDTDRELMDIRYKDVSNLAWNTEPYVILTDETIKSIVTIAADHIREFAIEDCDVTMTQLNDRWDVRCGPSVNFVQKCRFEIVNGQVRDIVN